MNNVNQKQAQASPHSLRVNSLPDMSAKVCLYADKSCPDISVHIADKIPICTEAKPKRVFYANGQLDPAYPGKLGSVLTPNFSKKN